jgi:hypothetical protein
VDRAETPEQRWNRIQADVQSTILKDYPNPTRKGCPGLEVIRSLAKRAAAFDGFVNDSNWEHVTHCSPCYQEFLDVREALRGELRQGTPPAQK